MTNGASQHSRQPAPYSQRRFRPAYYSHHRGQPTPYNQPQQPIPAVGNQHQSGPRQQGAFPQQSALHYPTLQYYGTVANNVYPPQQQQSWVAGGRVSVPSQGFNVPSQRIASAVNTQPQVPVAPTDYKSKRKSHRLAIIDPKTGKDIFDTDSSPAVQQPQTEQNNDAVAGAAIASAAVVVAAAVAEATVAETTVTEAAAIAIDVAAVGVDNAAAVDDAAVVENNAADDYHDFGAAKIAAIVAKDTSLTGDNSTDEKQQLSLPPVELMFPTPVCSAVSDLSFVYIKTQEEVQEEEVIIVDDPRELFAYISTLQESHAPNLEVITEEMTEEQAKTTMDQAKAIVEDKEDSNTEDKEDSNTEDKEDSNPEDKDSNREDKEDSYAEDKGEKSQSSNHKNEVLYNNNNSSKSPKLKYQYEEGQWSPINTEGKKIFSRDFLMNMRYEAECLKKPDGLLKELEKKEYDEPSTKSSIDFTPGYVVSAEKIRQHESHYRGPATNKAQPKVINLTLERDYQLHQTKNAWAPSHKSKTYVDEETAKTEAVYKSVKAILNKLTPTKFDTLVNKVLTLEINTEERLKGSINIIFEKAIDEPSFSVAYAKMAECMMALKVPSTENPDSFINFRSVLLGRCQAEFSRKKTSEKDTERREQEIEEAEKEEDKNKLRAELKFQQAKEKRHSLGNIRFIGELFKLKLLSATIMHSCIKTLIVPNDEERLESLCKLLTTIGKNIDVGVNKDLVSEYFDKLSKIVEERNTSSRIRFMIQDVIDLRVSNKWVPRNKEGPTTIDAIHKQAKKQEQERQKLVESLPNPSVSAQGNCRGQRRENLAPVSEGKWSSVTKSNHIDPKKMKFTKTKQIDESSIKLGPQFGKTSMWARSAKDGGDRNSSKEIPSNRFLLLNNDFSEDESENLAPASAAPLPSKPAKASQSPEDVERKTNSLLREFLLNNDIQEAIACVKEIDCMHMHLLAYTIINGVLEKNQKGRQAVGKLLVTLVKEGVLTVKQYLQGLGDVMEFAEDMEIDIPRIWQYLGELMGPMVQEDGSVPLHFLHTAVRPLSVKAGKLLAEVLHNAADRLGPQVVKDLWSKSGLKLEEFLEEQNLENYINENKLNELLSVCTL